MPIKLPTGHPARQALRSELVDFTGERDVAKPDGPALQIALLNLMPCKEVTETQLARMLGGTPFPVELTLFVPDGYVPKTTPQHHMAAFYRRLWASAEPGDSVTLTLQTPTGQIEDVELVAGDRYDWLRLR